MVDPNFPQDVAEFHEASGQLHGQAPRLLDGTLPYDTLLSHLKAAYVLTKLPSTSEGEVALRIGLILEEVAELIEAVRDGDLVQQLDAQLDIVYVTLGMGVTQGLPLNLGWEEVHRTNMNKVRGQPRDIGGKIQKPEGWVGPGAKLKELIERMRGIARPPFYASIPSEELVFDVEVLPSEVTPEVTPEEENDHARGTLQQDEQQEADADAEVGGESSSGSAGDGSGGGLYGKW